MKNLSLLIALFFISIINSIAQNCQNTVTLNTSYNHSTSSSYSVGAWDSYWTVIAGPTSTACGTYVYPSPANVITPVWGAGTVFPSSQWLSFRPGADLNCTNTCSSGDKPVVFQRTFCMVKPDTVVIDVNMRFDNSSCLFVDGLPNGTGGINVPLTPTLLPNTPTTLTSVSGGNNCQPCDLWNDTKTFSPSYDVRTNKFKIYLLAGTHNIQIRLRNNTGVSFGVILSGTIKGTLQPSNFLCPNECQVNNGIVIQKVLDNNCDGKNNTGDAIGTGWQFNVTGPGGFSQTVTTDISGYAFLTNLVAGTYTATEIAQNGWTASNPTQTVTVSNNQTGNLTFYNCPKPCIEIKNQKIECGPIVGGVQTYIVSGFISNGNSIALSPIVTTTSGTPTNSVLSSVPAGATNIAFSFSFTPNAGVTNPCWVIKYADDNGNVICSKDFCLPLPICKCLELSYKLECNQKKSPNTPDPYVFQVTVNNPTASSISIPMNSSTGTLSPSSITIAANASFTFLVYYTPTTIGPDACIAFGTGIVPLPIPICKPPAPCVKLPDCCIDADGKLSCGPVVNGIQTYVFSGSITNYNTTTSTPSITSNVLGSVSGITPSTIPAFSSSLTTFNFAPTTNLVPNSTICFYFAPLKGAKNCDSVCLKVPECPKPCIDAAVLVASCETINGVQTLVVKGAVTSGNLVPTTLSVSSISGGTASLVPPTVITVPALAINHAFTIHLPSPSSSVSTYCFEVVLSTSTQPQIKCKDTICVKNPCPKVTDCCPKTTVKPCICPGTTTFITYEFTSTIPANVCKLTISSAPSFTYIPSNISVNGSNVGSFTSNMITLSSVTGTVNFSIATLIGSATTFTLTYTLCDGTECKQTFNLKKKVIGDVVQLTSEKVVETLFAYKLRIWELGKSDEKVKFISVLLESENDVKDLIFALSGSSHFGDKNNSILSVSDAIQGSHSATFVLSDAIALNKIGNGLDINLVTKSKLKSVRYSLYDEEGALLSEGKNTKLDFTTVSTSSKEFNDNFNISVSPNPVSDKANITFSSSIEQIISIELLNMNGQIVKTIESSIMSNKESKTTTIDVSDLTKGLYFVRIKNEKGQSFVEKLSVVH